MYHTAINIPIISLGTTRTRYFATLSNATISKPFFFFLVSEGNIYFWCSLIISETNIYFNHPTQ